MPLGLLKVEPLELAAGDCCIVLVLAASGGGLVLVVVMAAVFELLAGWFIWTLVGCRSRDLVVAGRMLGTTGRFVLGRRVWLLVVVASSALGADDVLVIMILYTVFAGLLMVELPVRVPPPPRGLMRMPGSTSIPMSS